MEDEPAGEQTPKKRSNENVAKKLTPEELQAEALTISKVEEQRRENRGREGEGEEGERRREKEAE
jgi:hypothetical protein